MRGTNGTSVQRGELTSVARVASVRSLMTKYWYFS